MVARGAVHRLALVVLSATFGYTHCSSTWVQPVQVQTRRVWETSSSMRSAAFIAFTGTRLRATPSYSVWSQTQGSHHFIHVGWGCGPYTNRSAGVYIGVNTKWTIEGDIHRTSAPPTTALRRGGLVRLTSASIDVTLLCASLPLPLDVPTPHGKPLWEHNSFGWIRSLLRFLVG